MTVPAAEVPPRRHEGAPASPRSWVRTVLLALLVTYGLVQIGLEVHDLYLSTWEHHVGDPSLFGMPLGHEAMLDGMSGAGGSGLTGGYLIKGGYSPVLEFISQLETAYAVLWLVCLTFFLVVVGATWRTGRRWPWLACWLIVVGHLGAAACFGPYSAELLRFHTISAAIPAALLVALAAVGDPTPVVRTGRASATPARW